MFTNKTNFFCPITKEMETNTSLYEESRTSILVKNLKFMDMFIPKFAGNKLLNSTTKIDEEFCTYWLT